MSEQSGEIDLGLGILDHQLVDSDGRRCGKVDDLELEGVAEGKPRVAAILTGPGAWRGRGRIGSALARLGGSRMVKVPWDEVAAVEAGVRLRKPAAELRLGRGDRRMERWVEKLPGASLE
jgi:sporulation protein YlmC with PRC-barrel domain